MQRVSNEYKQSMKNLLRGRGYIKIAFGLINQEAQANAVVSDGEFAYFSNPDNVFTNKTEDIVYATMEENFTKVDGSMFFLPRERAGAYFYDTGVVGERLVSESPQEFLVELNILPVDFKGLTVDFGENYPVDFDIQFGENGLIEVRDNTTGQFCTEDVLTDTDYVKLIVYTMKNPASRLRVYSITFGYGLVYTNDSVLDSTLDSYISAIGRDVPTIDFSVKLKNYDQYFNVDNPKSAINFLETGQPMEIYYGLMSPSGKIEWIKGNTLQCSGWEADDFSATIRSQDMLRDLDNEYYKGTYSSQGVSCYDLAVDVLTDAEVTDYYVDSYLKNIFSKNPLPRVRHKEALQIIANAARCVLSQTRDGKIRIKSSFRPDISASSESEAEYSNVSAILDGSKKEEYAELGANYTTADGGMFFIPRIFEGNVINTGFVSAVQSDENCIFSENPVITIQQEVAAMYYGVKFVFGNSQPGEFIIRTYNGEDLVAEYTVTGNLIGKSTFISYDFEDFDKMVVEFTKTKEPFNRIVLNNFSFGDVTDFTMTRTDMTSSPKAIKQELVKEVVVPCYSYQNGAREEQLVTEEISVTRGEVVTFYLNNPSYGYRAVLENFEGGVSVVESGSYFVTVQFSQAGTFKLEIYGYEYKIVERYAVQKLNERGKTIRWENPLVSDITVATDLARWLGEYYTGAVEYEYDTRGNPELDVSDIIYQENDFIENMEVTVYKQTLKFAQSFSGKVAVHRRGGVPNGLAKSKNRLVRNYR